MLHLFAQCVRPGGLPTQALKISRPMFARDVKPTQVLKKSDQPMYVCITVSQLRVPLFWFLNRGVINEAFLLCKDSRLYFQKLGNVFVLCWKTGRFPAKNMSSDGTCLFQSLILLLGSNQSQHTATRRNKCSVYV